MSYLKIHLLLGTLMSMVAPVIARSTPQVLVGTWTSKSAAVLTGTNFYDPHADSFTEPSHPGISYSFDGAHYESAAYITIPNPTTPRCISAVLQFQHGTYTILQNNSIHLTPFSSDGRMQTSKPCKNKYSQYVRYSQEELVAKWEVGMDSYLGAERLDLVMADGKKVQPLYLAYRPPVMGPKSAVNPAAPDGAKKKTKATGKPMFKRELHELGGDDDDDDNDDTQAEADGKNNAKQSRDIVHGDDIVRIYRNKAAEEAGYDLPLIALWVAFTMIGIGSVTLLCN